MFTFTGLISGDDLGNSVSLAGDLNGDGYHDIVIGAPGYSYPFLYSNVGAISVVYGGQTTSLSDMTLPGTPDPLTTGFYILGNLMGDKFGFSVSCAGDINNDGYDDIIIGAPFKSNARGAVYVVYGGKNQDLQLLDLSYQTLNPATTGFMITGEATNGYFGYSVSNAGDINNDGYADMLIGAPGRDEVYVIYGAEKSAMTNIDLSNVNLDPATTGFTLKGNALGDYFGGSVTSAGDIDKDGYDDLIIGAWHKNDNKGAAYIVYGGETSSMSNIDLSETTLKPATTGFALQGRTTGDEFGFSVNSAGDFNNDGYDDMIIGAVNTRGGQGAAYVIYGGKRSSLVNIDLSKVTLDPAKTGLEIIGDVVGDRFGASVSCAGDVNKDGYDDVIIGADEKNPNSQGTSYQGAAYVIYGGAKSSLLNMQLSKVTLDPAANGFVIMGNNDYEEFGNSVSAGDINNDGISDLLVGGWTKELSTGFAYAYVSDKCADHCGKCDYFEAVCGACSLGYRLDNNQCLACISNCDTCADSSTCQVCSLGFSLLGTDCTASCPDQMYSENRVCKDCPTMCSKCTSESVCQECKPSYFKYDSQCLASCPAKTYLSGADCFDCPTGCSKCTSDSVCEACDEGYIFLSDAKVCLSLEAQEKKSQKIFAEVFEGTFLASAALSSGSSLPFNFALVTKVLRNLRYLDVTVSTDLTETFYTWKVADGFLNAPKSWSEKSKSKALPTVFSRYGLDPVFLINFWKPLVLSVAGLVVFVIFKLTEVILRKKKRGISHKVSRHVNIAASNFALTLFYCNLDDVILYFVFEFRTTKFDNGFRIVSSVLAIVLLVLGGLFMCLHLMYVREYQKLKNAHQLLEIFKGKCENIKLIFKDFRETTFFKQSFLFTILLRSIISSIIFATLFDYPVLQTTLLLILNLAMVVLQLAKNSFKETLNRWGQFFAEIVLVIAVSIMFVLSMLDYADSHPSNGIEKLSKCVIILNAVLMLGCSAIMILSLGKSFYESFNRRRQLSRVSALPDHSVAAQPVNNNMISFAN